MKFKKIVATKIAQDLVRKYFFSDIHTFMLKDCYSNHYRATETWPKIIMIWINVHEYKEIRENITNGFLFNKT